MSSTGEGDGVFAQVSENRLESCYHCCGYYGTANGDPLCSICHDFLYVEDFDISVSQQYWGYGLSQSQADKDDGDSGNDEPSEDAAPAPLLVNRQNEELSVKGAGAPDEPQIESVRRVPTEDCSINANAPCFSGSTSLPKGDVNSDESPSEEVYSVPRPYSPTFRQQERITRRLALLTVPIPSYEVVPKIGLTNLLPPEIWRMVFQKLDPISLLLASRVRPNWKSIILEMISNEIWKSFVVDKWPLFSPIYDVNDWYSVFATFLHALPCCSCWIKMNTPSIALPPTADDDLVGFRSLRSARLNKELKWLRADHPDGIEAVPLDHLNYNWLARIIGPPQSPYQGGIFYLNIKIPHDYPLKPPVVRFLTKVYHPNISRHGDIGVDCIQHNWTLALYIPQTLLSVQSLLTDPWTESSMEPAIAHQYLNDKKAFENKARIWTWKYAMVDVLLT